MNHYRVHDAVAKLSRVKLQNTVSVLNALYVVSKTLEVEDEPGMSSFRQQLENILIHSAKDSQGHYRSLREAPDEEDVEGCYELCEKVEEHCLTEMCLIQRCSPTEILSAPKTTSMNA